MRRDGAEADLVREAQDGSADAFTELLRRSRPRLMYAARSILKTREEAEDAVQAASWKAFERLETFRGESSFNTWLTSIVVNQARMRRRELRRAQFLFLDDGPESLAPRLADGAPTAEEAYAGEELVQVLHREIRRLPAQLRQVMLLHVQNLSMMESAERLGVSLSAAKARLFRARLQLYERMRPYASVRTVAA